MSEPTAYATYRHDVTGLVGVYPRRLGDNDPHLTEVKADAKPLKPALIPRRDPKAAPDTRKATSGERNSSTPNKRK